MGIRSIDPKARDTKSNSSNYKLVSESKKTVICKLAA